MKDDPIERVKKSLERLYPKELADKLKSITLTEDQVFDIDNVHSNFSNYYELFSSLVNEYEEKKPGSINAHILKTIISDHFKNNNEFLNQIKERYQVIANDNKYIIPFYLLMILRFKECYTIIEQQFYDIERLMRQVEESAYFGGLLKKLDETESFEGKARQLKLISDKITEAFYKDIIVKLGLLLGDNSIKEMTLGQALRKLRKNELIEKVIPFIFDENILLLRNASAHSGYDIDYEKKLICLYNRKGKLIKTLTTKQTQDTIGKVMLINSGFTHAEVILFLLYTYELKTNIFIGEHTMYCNVEKERSSDGSLTINVHITTCKNTEKKNFWLDINF